MVHTLNMIHTTIGKNVRREDVRVEHKTLPYIIHIVFHFLCSASGSLHDGATSTLLLCILSSYTPILNIPIIESPGFRDKRMLPLAFATFEVYR